MTTEARLIFLGQRLNQVAGILRRLKTDEQGRLLIQEGDRKLLKLNSDKLSKLN